MLVFLIHVRDPQFYAVPALGRAKNGNLRIMGFPPIGIMSLSAVLKRAGHECVMFDQANPETPNPVMTTNMPAAVYVKIPFIIQHLPCVVLKRSMLSLVQQLCQRIPKNNLV